MTRFVDPLVHNTMLDANLLDEVASKSSAAVNRIIELSGSGDEIIIVLPYSVCDEVNHPATPAPVREAATHFIYSIPLELATPEAVKRDRFIREAKGNSQRKNVERDLQHIYEAGKCGAGHFVTRDRWLQRNSELIWGLARVEILTPEQFVKKTEAALRSRASRQTARNR